MGHKLKNGPGNGNDNGNGNLKRPRWEWLRVTPIHMGSPIPIDDSITSENSTVCRSIRSAHTEIASILFTAYLISTGSCVQDTH